MGFDIKKYLDRFSLFKPEPTTAEEVKDTSAVADPIATATESTIPLVTQLTISPAIVETSVDAKEIILPESTLPDSAEETSVPLEDSDHHIVGVTVDLHSIIKLFGINNYSSKLVDVSVKELLQNSFDAVRGAYAGEKLEPGQGIIHIDVDPDRRSIRIDDNGIGMSPEKVRDYFLRIGATLKENLSSEQSSGGFGLAKLAFLFAGKQITVRSRYDGVESSLITNGTELLDHTSKLHKRSTAEPNGTSVEIVFPETMEQSDGNVRNVSFPDKIDEIKCLSKPLIGTVTVKAKIKGKKETTLPLGYHYDDSAMPLVAEMNTKWGSVDLFMAAQPQEMYKRSRSVLSSGLYQFDATFFSVERPFMCDVRSNVKAEHRYYPFNKQREGWNASISDDVDGIEEIVKLIDELRKNEVLRENFRHAKVILRRVNQGREAFDFEDMEKTPRQECAFIHGQAPLMIFKEDGIYCDGIKFFDRSYSGFAQGPGAKNLLGSQAAPIVVPYPVFHSNLNVDIIEATANNAKVEASAVRNVVGELAYAAHDFLSKIFTISDCDKPETQNPIFGLSFDKTYRGVKISSPYHGAFLNPAAWSAETLAGWAHGCLHAMMHETVHWTVSGHMDNFTSALGTLYGKIEDAYPGLYVKTLEWLTNFAVKNQNILCAMRDVAGDDATLNNGDGLHGVALRVQEEHRTAKIPKSSTRRKVLHVRL
jgi:hypothetical protein